MAAPNHILKKYSVAPTALIGRGMEADVYAFDEDKVLKIYAGTATYADLVVLKEFYASLERSRLPYAVPTMYAVEQEDGCVVTVEERLTGRSLATTLPHLNQHQLDAAMDDYLSAVIVLANIKAPNNLNQLKLFDPQQLSQTREPDWHQFLLNYLNYKHPQLQPFLERDVDQFPHKFSQLQELLSMPYTGAYKLIHGDFYPGNLLIDEQNQTSALIDFGFMTMYGDPLFDVATSWLFFDMYDELKVGIYERLQAMLRNVVGHEAFPMLHRYILIYSILTANSYSANCSDGHYQWCVANLNLAAYWDHLA